MLTTLKRKRRNVNLLKIDLIIPTYRRPQLLQILLQSIEQLTPVNEATLVVHVADNNSGDETPEVVRAFAGISRFQIHYHLVRPQGRSSAINGALIACTGDLVAFIDDDEALWPDWLRHAVEAWIEHQPDFLGGPCVPRAEIPIPRWVPRNWPAVLGDIRGPDAVTPYDALPNAMFMGGNAILRRDLFVRLGGYHPALGRTGSKRLMSCEDRDLDLRLRESSARGFWVPGMKVWHDVPESRLTKSYFRRWASDHGASLTFFARLRHIKPKRSVLGIELWRLRETFRSLTIIAVSSFKKSDPAIVFSHELKVREVVGMLRGRFLSLPDYQPISELTLPGTD